MNAVNETTSVPLSDMIYQMASAVAASQVELDRKSIDIFRSMCDAEESPVILPGMSLGEDDIKISMLGAGFQPTFYQFTDTILEVRMAVSVNYSETGADKKSGMKKLSAHATPINASYSSKYSFSQDSSSMFRTRLVPVPPNPIMQRRIDMHSRIEQLKYEKHIKDTEDDLNKGDSE